MKMTLGKKLAWCFAGTSLLSATLGVCGWIGVTRTAHELDSSVHLTARKVALASDLKYSMLTMRFSERGIELFASIGGEEKKIVNKKLLDTTVKKLAADIVEIRPLLQTDQEQQLLSTAEAAIKEWTDGQVPVYRLVLTGQVREAIQLDMDTLVKPGTTATNALQELGTRQQAFYDQAVERVHSIAGLSKILVVTLLALSIVLGLMAALVIRRSTRDLRMIASHLGEGAEQVAAAASQVSSSSQSLAQGASEQAASLEETSASSEEINSMARKNSDNTRSAAALLQQSEQKMGQANHYLAEMVTSMGEISASSGKISKIIKVIDEIAFQTNILALNAAVEAARAGEAGMGFAVVADEVRSLAQRSAQAAKDTAVLIEESIATSNEGKLKVDQVTVAIRAMSEDAARVRVMVDEVSVGSEQQSRGIDQIGKAISQVEQVTQTTAASAEQSAAAAEELNAQSETMNDVVASLRAMVDSGTSEGMRSVRASRRAA